MRRFTYQVLKELNKQFNLSGQDSDTPLVYIILDSVTRASRGRNT